MAPLPVRSAPLVWGWTEPLGSLRYLFNCLWQQQSKKHGHTIVCAVYVQSFVVVYRYGR